MAVLAVLGLFLINRGGPETPKETAQAAAAPLPRQNAPALPPPSAAPAPSPAATASKTQAPQKPDWVQPQAAQKGEKSPAHANPPVAPAPANLEPQKTTGQAQTLNTKKGLETAKVSSQPDADEEEALVPEKKPANPSATKSVDKETADIGLFKPQAGESPLPGPAPKVAEPEKKNTDIEQRLKRGEWISLFTKDDHANWKLEKPDCWKLQGDTLAGSGKLQYNGINLTNYEMKAEISLQKGASLSFVLRSNDEIAYRVQVGDKAVAGQLWDYKQKKVKKQFERVELDTKGYLKVLVQSKGRYLRVALNDKDVLLEYDEVPLDTTGFYIGTYKSNGAVKNVSIRALY
ncbi:MAG: hypothetical protein HY291_06390 [Planctomycetes bacterium]|nr:hypothetical protein [Planctomycetota bacterium]